MDEGCDGLLMFGLEGEEREAADVSFEPAKLDPIEVPR